MAELPKSYTDATSVEGVQALAKDGRVPAYVKKLIEGYDMRTYWFELFECGRKILLVGMPVFFDMGSIAQLVFGLMVCFLSFGTYMMLAPYANDSDDRLAQLCQMQIFFTLISSMMLRWDDLNAAAGGRQTETRVSDTVVGSDVRIHFAETTALFNLTRDSTV